MEDTPIDLAHDWTHTAEFETVVYSERYRMMVREVADLLQGMMNMASRKEKDIQLFDAIKLRQRLKGIEGFLPRTG